MLKIRKVIPLLLCMCMAVILKPMSVSASGDGASDLWVNGTNLATGGTVICGDGIAIYEPAANTLTLENATIDQTSATPAGARLIYIGKNFSGLKIILSGTNTLPGNTGYGIRSECDFTITGSGSLTVSGGSGALNVSGGSLTIDGTTVSLSASGGCISTTSRTDVVKIINGSKVTIDCNNTGEYFCSVGGGFAISDSEMIAASTGYGLCTETGAISIENSTVTVSSSKPSLAAFDNSTVNISGSNVNLTSSDSNAIYAESTLTINDTDITASGKYPAFWAGKAITILGNSKVNASSTDGYGIFSKESVSISGSSHITASGGIKANGPINFSPVNSEKFDILAGDDEKTAVPIPGSPFSESVNLAGLNLEKYPYVRSQAHVHRYDQEVEADQYKASDASCTVAATYYKSCRCGEKGTEIFTGPAPSGHRCGTEWKTDTVNHWLECSVCGEKVDVAPHTSDEGKVTTAATASQTGVKTYSCSVCSRVLKTEIIPVTITPKTTEAPGAANTQKNGTQTGDSENLIVWIVLLLLSGTGLAFYIRKKKAY